MTNQLFRDYLDGRIPVRPMFAIGGMIPRPGYYFLPNLADPTAPTMKELAAGVNISEYMIINLPPQAGLTTPARETDYEAINRAIGKASESLQEMSAATGMSAEEIMALLAKAGARPDKVWTPTYVMPPPKPWAGNIATQKRRRRL